jgi:hypothetical protein
MLLVLLPFNKYIYFLSLGGRMFVCKTINRSAVLASIHNLNLIRGELNPRIQPISPIGVVVLTNYTFHRSEKNNMNCTTAVNSLQSDAVNGAGGAFDDSTTNLLQQLLANGFLGQTVSFQGRNTANGTTAQADTWQQQQQAMNLAANTSLFFPSDAVSVSQQIPVNNMMIQAAAVAQGSGNFSAATSCALSRWISSQSSANNQAAAAAAMNIPPSIPLPGQMTQQQTQATHSLQQQQADNEPLPFTNISFPEPSFLNLGNNASNMMNTQDLLLGGEQQQQSLQMPSEIPSSNLVSDNDLDSSSQGVSASDANKAARFRRDQAEQWSERYDELILFLKDHGHCRVPRNHKKYGAL